MSRCKFFLLAAVTAWFGRDGARGQTVVFGPQPRSAVSAAFLNVDATVWAVSVCAPPGSAVATGRLLAIAAGHGVAPIQRQLALRMLQTKQHEHWAVRTGRYGGYLSALAAYLLASETIRAKPQWLQGTTAAAGGLGILLPLVAREKPRFGPDFESLVLGGGLLQIGPSGCEERLFFATRTADEKPFTAKLE